MKTPALAVHDGADGAVRYESDSLREMTAQEDASGIEPFDIAFPPGDVRRYGAVGDYVNDDTDAIRTAIAICTRSKQTLNMGCGCYRITGPLVFTCPVRFDACSYGDSNAGQVGPGHPGFYPVGSGYTAVTFDNCVLMMVENITVIGNLASRPIVNGIYVLNGQRFNAKNLIVTGVVGFGVKVETSWDSVYENISILECGNADEYAFQVTNTPGQSTNECVFNRVQVERANTKAVYVSPDTYNCTFNVIHSEQVRYTASDMALVPYTHDIRGNFGMTFTSVRLTGGNGTTLGPKVRFGAYIGTYSSIRIEDDSGSNAAQVDILYGTPTGSQTYISMEVQGAVAGRDGNLTYTTFIGLQVTGSVSIENTANPAHYRFFGGTLAMRLVTNGTQASAYGSVITSYTVDGSGQVLRCFGCNITASAASSFPTAAILEAENCVFSNNITFSVGGGTVVLARASRFLGTVTIQGNNALLSVDNCEFTNGITLGAGNVSWRFGPSNRISGGSISAGLLAAPGGTYQFYPGERSFRITPTAGQPKSWVCTVAGTPGTWSSEGNL